MDSLCHTSRSESSRRPWQPRSPCALRGNPSRCEQRTHWVSIMPCVPRVYWYSGEGQVLAWSSGFPVLFQQRFEQGVPRVHVELDVQLCRHLVRKLHELFTSGDGDEKRGCPLFYGEFCDGDSFMDGVD